MATLTVAYWLTPVIRDRGGDRSAVPGDVRVALATATHRPAPVTRQTAGRAMRPGRSLLAATGCHPAPTLQPPAPATAEPRMAPPPPAAVRHPPPDDTDEHNTRDHAEPDHRGRHEQDGVTARRCWSISRLAGPNTSNSISLYTPDVGQMSPTRWMAVAVLVVFAVRLGAAIELGGCRGQGAVRGPRRAVLPPARDGQPP